MARIDPHVSAAFPAWEERFRQFELGLDEWEQRFYAATEIAIDEQEAFAATRKWTARRLISFQAANTAARMFNLGEGVISTLNLSNRHLLPAVARTLLETAAVPAYANRHLIPLLKKRRAKRAKIMLFRLGLGGDPGASQVIRPYPVSSLVNALADEIAEHLATSDPSVDVEEMRNIVPLLYSTVSDHTHPNSAAMELSFVREDSERGGGRWTLRQPLLEGDIASWFAIADLMVEFVGPIWDAVMTAGDAHPLSLPSDQEFGVDDFGDEHLNSRAS